MRFPVSSNIVTAVYVIFFDFLLQFALSRLAHVFLSSRNLKSIYDDRKPFCLTSTRFAILTHQGLSKKGVGRAVAILSTAIVALAIAGSFSINGVSRKLTKAKRVAVLVDKATPNEVVDFSLHVSEDGQLASDTFLAINGAVNCYDSNSNVFIRYPAISDLQAVNAMTWKPTTTVANSTCVTKVNGYVEESSMHIPYLSVPWDPKSCDIQFRVEGKGKLAPAQANLRGACPFELSTAWCSTYQLRVCTALVKFQECYSVLVKVDSEKNLRTRIFRTCHDEKLHSTSIRSLAYLLDTGAVSFRWWWWAGTMVLLKVRTDTYVHEVVGHANETDLNVLFIAITLGSAFALMIIFAIATFYSWRLYVAKPKRRFFNPFHSTLDMLSFTVSELQKDGTRLLKRKGGIFVFLVDDVLHVKPDLESSEQGS